MKTPDKKHNIYLDSAATTRLDPGVIQSIHHIQTNFSANASSQHQPGLDVMKGVERARMIIAARIRVAPDEIIFTGSGTEANNLAVKGTAFALRDRGRHIVISSIEHPSVLEPARWLEARGFEVTVVPVDGEGLVDPECVADSIRDDTMLVSIIHASNEIGTIQPIGIIGALCRERGVRFHVDACQSFTKVALDVREQHLDMVTLNAHKIHGPKGVGALFVREGLELEPVLHGGDQERKHRSGTYNTAGIIGFGQATDLVFDRHIDYMRDLRDSCLFLIEDEIDGVILNGSRNHRLCNNINIIFDGVSGKAVFTKLNARGIYMSTGSACSSSKLEPSRILLAIGRTPDQALGAIRLSLSRFTTQDEINSAVEALVEIVTEERASGSSIL